MLGYDETITIGLILNELLTNSDKYAFDTVKEPCISIDLTRKDDACIFVYSDNGPGFDPSHLAQNSGMGYDLIHGFIAKNNASISIVSKNGLSITITFPKGQR
jgi:two-component system, sensor histidine kinase PdtaS